MFFNLFGGGDSDENALFTDLVWIDTANKTTALAERCKQNPTTLFMAWFPATAEAFKKAGAPLGIPAEAVVLAANLQLQQVQQHTIVWLEHYPLHSKELELIQRLQLPKVDVCGAMDEAIFIRFGSEKMIPMVKLLGFKASEPIRHSYVTASINKSQQKMADRVPEEKPANSMEEWLRVNNISKQDQPG